MKSRNEIFNLAASAETDRSIIDSLYEKALSFLPGEDDGDAMADAMTVEAVCKKLAGETVAAPAWANGMTDEQHTIDWVKISTTETVPVFTPKDGGIIFSEW